MLKNRTIQTRLLGFPGFLIGVPLVQLDDKTNFALVASTETGDDWAQF